MTARARREGTAFGRTRTGESIARRISSGRHILVANHTQEAADAAAKVLENAGFETTAMQADVSDRALVQAVVRKPQERCNSLRVRGEAVQWAKRGARINSISPGIIVTPLAHDELHGECADFYQAMLKKMPAGRAGTPDEVAALIMGPEGGFITGSDFLIDGGATADFLYGPGARAA